MSTVTMNIQEALAKKKILENRLSELKGQKLLYVTAATEVATTVNGYKREDIENKLKSNFDSMRHLISNLRELKCAINMSNATTKITVAGKEYTVADAIARYNSISSERLFLSKCIAQYTTVTSQIEDTNTLVSEPERIAAHVGEILGSESKKNESIYNAVVEDYKKNNILYIIDPNNLEEVLLKWKDELDQFEADIHTALITSNIQTQITVEFED